MDNKYYLTGYEKRIINNKRKSNADLIKDNRMFANTVKECLSLEFETELEDGTKVDVPLAKLLVAKKISYLMEHPEKIDLKEITGTLGESKLETDLNVKGAEELFGDIANESK